MGPYKSGAPVTQTRIVFPFYIILPLAAPAFASWSAISLYVSPV